MLYIEKELSDNDLLEAIHLRLSAHFTALNIANILGGRQTDAWAAARKFTPFQLIGEAELRHLNLNNLWTACDERPVTESEIYQEYLAGKVNNE